LSSIFFEISEKVIRWWSRKKSYLPCFVIPAKAGIQLFQYVLDSRLRGSDDIFTFYEAIIRWWSRKKSKISSPLTGEGEGGGDKLPYFCMLFPPPLSPLPPGEGKIYFLRIHHKRAPNVLLNLVPNSIQYWFSVS